MAGKLSAGSRRIADFELWGGFFLICSLVKSPASSRTTSPARSSQPYESVSMARASVAMVRTHLTRHGSPLAAISLVP
jgi:hypothetical protein